MSAIDGKILATKSDCYKSARKMTPRGIVVHSTGCNNPNLKRYVAPDDGVIGNNPNNNSFNEPGQDVCVHAVIGKDRNGNVKTYQILPFDICCWGVGSGSKGSYNYSPAYIQFEMCEDGLTDKVYCTAVYNKAVELCAYLCKTYNLSTDNIVSHNEARQQGMGSSHVDPDNWWGKHGYTMDKFRAAVKAALEPPVLDKTGYKRGSDTIGSYGLKLMLLLAREKKLQPYNMDVNSYYFGDGTENAVNCLLKKWGYSQNGVAGKNFEKKLYEELKRN
ncbi:MAG: N-acetylmuramoyl-L-alanine amidase family protein [Porcipelethomonas sp.]